MADNYTGTEWKTRTQISTELMSKIDEGIMIATNAAENAKNDAETAQKSAEAAQELAESSKEAAEAAQTAATEAQSAAEASASDVEEAKKLAEEAQEAANIASSDAESAKDAAETAQKALESIPSDIENFETTLNEVKSDISKLEDEINTLNSDLTSQSTGTITSDFATSANSCYRVGYAVNIRLQASDVSFTGTSAVLGTLPDGFKPRRTQYLFGRVRPVSSNELSVAMFTINTDGNITQAMTNGECNYFQVGGTILL